MPLTRFREYVRFGTPERLTLADVERAFSALGPIDRERRRAQRELNEQLSRRLDAMAREALLGTVPCEVAEREERMRAREEQRHLDRAQALRERVRNEPFEDWLKRTQKVIDTKGKVSR